MQQQCIASLPVPLTSHRATPGLSFKASLAWHQRALNKAEFNWQFGPLWRVRLLHKGEQCAALFSFCSLIFDGGSLPVFFERLEMLLNEPDESTPVQHGQYLDYVYWQDSALSEARWSADLQWWLAQLKSPPVASLSGPGRGTPPNRARVYEQLLGRDELEQISAFASGHQTTPFVVMLTAFGRALSEVREVPNPTVAIPLAQRAYRQSADMIGSFTRFLPLTLPLCGEIRDVQAVHQLNLQAQTHASIPHGLISHALQSQGKDPAEPFRIVFNPLPPGSTSVDEEQTPASCDFIKPGLQTAIMQEEEMIVRIEPQGAGLRLRWFVREDRIEPRIIKTMMLLFMDNVRDLLSEA